MPSKNFGLDAVTVTITEILKEMGMPVNLVGYDYTHYGIKLVLEDKTLASRRVTTALYPAIAARFDTTASRVERGIRYAIRSTFDRISPGLLEKYFGNTIRCGKDSPTNREFLAVLAGCVPKVLAGAPAEQTNPTDGIEPIKRNGARFGHRKYAMDDIKMRNVWNFLKMDLADLSERTPLSEEDGVIEFRPEAAVIESALKRAGINLGKVKDGRIRAVFLMRCFYVLGVLRGGEAARGVILDRAAIHGQLDLSGECARLFLSELAGLDSLTMEVICKTLGLKLTYGGKDLG